MSNIDYSISDIDAEFLKALSTQQAAQRATLAKMYLTERGLEAFSALFVQFVGLANSVAENCREMAEMLLVEEGMHPYSAEKINLPTIFGAANGVVLANAVKQRGTCQGCAYRRGTIANQSPVTTEDAASTAVGGDQHFMCHEKLDDAGNPTHVCAGHAQIVRVLAGTGGHAQ